MFETVFKALAGWKGYAALALVCILTTGVAIWTIQDWHYGQQIAKLQRDQETGRANANAQALEDLQKDLQTISEAAKRAAAVAPQLTAQLGKLSQALKNAKPLPADCRPDPDRVRVFTDAVHAANRAAAGQPTGGALPTASGSAPGTGQLR